MIHPQIGYLPGASRGFSAESNQRAIVRLRENRGLNWISGSMGAPDGVRLAVRNS